MLDPSVSETANPEDDDLLLVEGCKSLSQSAAAWAIEDNSSLATVRSRPIPEVVHFGQTLEHWGTAFLEYLNSLTSTTEQNRRVTGL